MRHFTLLNLDTDEAEDEREFRSRREAHSANLMLWATFASSRWIETSYLPTYRRLRDHHGCINHETQSLQEWI